jgi:hypothetical protein
MGSFFPSDDWLFNTRWELLIQNRAQIDIVEVGVIWNVGFVTGLLI